MGRANDAKKTHLILGGVMVGVIAVFAIIITVMMMGGDDPPPKKYSRYVTRPKQTKQAPRYPTGNTPAPPKVRQPVSKARPVLPSAPSSRQAQSARKKTNTAAATETARPLPVAMVQKVREGVLALPEFYQRKILPGGAKARLTSLVGAGKGTTEDLGFLEAVSGDLRVLTAREEMRKIEQELGRLAREAVETLPMDVLTLKDGRELTGKILESPPGQVRLERKLSSGVGGVMTFSSAQVKTVGKGKGVGSEFKKRWDEAKAGPVAKLETLMTWCRSSDLKVQAELACYSILKQDPGHLEARAAAGFAPDPFQVAAAPGAAPGAGAGGTADQTTLLYDGKRWAPFDLKEKLLKGGYALIDGRWYRETKKLITVPSLYKYFDRSSQPVTFSSTTVTVVTESEMSYSPKARTLGAAVLSTGGYANVPIEIDMNARKRELGRFYGTPMVVTPGNPFPAQGGSTASVKTYSAVDDIKPRHGFTQTGELAISIPLEQPLIEASVMMITEVQGGGTVTLYLKKGPARVKVQEISRSTRKSLDLPSDQILGMRQLNLVAVIRQKASYKKTSKKHTLVAGGFTKARGQKVRRRGVQLVHTQYAPDYQVKLMPCTSNTSQVFRLTAVVGEPVERLDTLFKDFPKVLK